jgi:arabinose-5-phosphate isomerase
MNIPAAPHTSTDTSTASLSLARRVLTQEAHAILDLCQRLDRNFVTALELLYACQGRVVVGGMGKSGLIGRKIAATLASTGTPAFFSASGRGQSW